MTINTPSPVHERSEDGEASKRNEDDATGVATAPESALDPSHPPHGIPLFFFLFFFHSLTFSSFPLFLSPSFPPFSVHKRFYAMSLLAAIGIFVMLSLLAALRSHPSYIIFACLFAPFGAITRWYLATYNLKFPKFPVFTFMVNFVGSLLVAGFTILVSRSHDFTGSAALNGAVTVCSCSYSLLFFLSFLFLCFLLDINCFYNRGFVGA